MGIFHQYWRNSGTDDFSSLDTAWKHRSPNLPIRSQKLMYPQLKSAMQDCMVWETVVGSIPAQAKDDVKDDDGDVR